jgi:hypothetical protein
MIENKTYNPIHPTFREVFYNHKGNGCDKWENYLDIYHIYLQRFIGNNPQYLEIGVQNGGSLQIASKYFINGNIHGIDIDPNVCKMSLGEGIKTYCFDVNEKDKINQIFDNISFDVLLDDGSHESVDIISAFQILFPKVSPGGVYIIEDMHTSYWKFKPYYGGPLKKDTAIEFFKKFVDLANFYHIENDEFFANFSDDDKYVVAWIESITFYDSVVVIKKLDKPRDKQYYRLIVGENQPIKTLS